MDLFLETERLILRPLDLDDVDVLTEKIGAVEIADTTLMVPHPYSVKDAIEWITGRLVREKDGASINLGFFLKSTGELGGSTGLVSIHKVHKKAELGYWCAVPLWGNGYATEATEKMIEYGFKNLDLVRIFSRCLTRNPASARVMIKLGMTYEGTARSEFFKYGIHEDFEHYSLLRSEYFERIT